MFIVIRSVCLNSILLLSSSFYRYPERRQPFLDRFSILKKNLIEHGTFAQPRPKIYNKENREKDEVNVLAYATVTPSTSCRNIEKEIGIDKSRSQKILRKYKYHPYKFKIVQNLHPGDADRRLIFCRWYTEQIQANANFGRLVIWSDESHVSSAGIFNRHNTRHWSEENQFVIYEREQQGRFGFGVSCFILGNQISYRIYEGGLTAIRYLEILEEVIPELLENVPLAELNAIHFQQDGAPSHNAHVVRPFLEDNFPQRWIGTNGAVRWPPRSPDLSVLDFFLWGFLQSKIYKTRNRTVEELRQATHLAFQFLQNHSIIILNALRRISELCELCIRENGNHFQQYL